MHNMYVCVYVYIYIYICIYPESFKDVRIFRPAVPARSPCGFAAAALTLSPGGCKTLLGPSPIVSHPTCLEIDGAAKRAIVRVGGGRETGRETGKDRER